MKRYFILFVCCFFFSCAGFKKAGRTINDVASTLCELFAEDHSQELDGFSPEQWCAVHDNLKPFVEYVLSAQQAAGDSALSSNKGDPK